MLDENKKCNVGVTTSGTIVIPMLMKVNIFYVSKGWTDVCKDGYDFSKLALPLK
jgi:hypothetical protein